MKYIYQTLFIGILNLILLWQPLAALPQAGSNSLYGTVTDMNGAVIPRAKITATLKRAPDSGNPRLFQTETNDEGKFLLKNLPSGIYDVLVSVEFSEAQTERVISVPEGKSVELVIQFGLGCERISEGSGILSEEDKAEVIRLTFAQAINPKLGLLMQEQRSNGVILSTKNIQPEWVKSLQGIKIKLMSQSQIQRVADRTGDFLYMSFPKVKVRGTCIAVTVTNTWAVSKCSRMAYLSGGGYTYEYRKESGKWVGKFVSGWIS